jgi:AcrR family transcriptional regulator
MPKIRASERDAFYEARRSEMAAVALQLWAERGFDQTSVAAIAAGAGVSKGTFYLYFESKEALLEDVLRRNSLLPNVEQLVKDLRSHSLEEAVHGFVRGAWRHLCEHRELVLVVLRELPTHLERAQQLVERVMVPANRMMADYLGERVDPARAEKLSLVISSRGLLGMIVFVFLTQEVLGAGRFMKVSEDELTSTLAELFLHGVTTSAPAENG